MTDNVSYYLKFIFRVLGGSHPLRLSAGFLLGLLLKGACDMFAKVQTESAIGTVLSENPTWFYVVLGIFLFFLPVFLGRTKLSENNRAYIELVGKVIESGNLSEAEQRNAWRTLLDKMLDNFKPDNENFVDTDAAAERVLKGEESGPDAET